MAKNNHSHFIRIHFLNGFPALIFLLILLLNGCEPQMERPNLIFVFGDQWRAKALVYAGNNQVKTIQ